MHVLKSLVLAVLLLAAPAQARWVAAWGSAQQVPEQRNEAPVEDMRDATVRQVVRVTLGGERFRVKLSNLFGTAPLKVSGVHLARSADAKSARVVDGGAAVTFGGRGEIVIPAGAEYLSDPVALSAAAETHLAVTMYLPEAPVRQTSHPGSRANSYFMHGNHVGAADLPGAKTIAHWYQLSGVETVSERAAAIAVIGDSITDGFGVQPDTDQRWPDFLSARLRADPRTREIAVINQGMGGNRVLLDELGPNAFSRFDRDVIGQRGVKWFILLEGVNDLGTFFKEPRTDAESAELVAAITGAYAQMVMKARERGIKAIGATIMPYGKSGTYKMTEASEAARQAINAWIRAPGHFDAVIDFDTAMRDPAVPTQLRADVDNDGLHPSIAGYKAMAEAVDLSLFVER